MIVSLTNFDSFKPRAVHKEVSRLTVDRGEMQKKKSLKTKLSQFNDKKFYFSNRVTTLPLYHPILKDQAKYKKEWVKKLEGILGMKKRHC